MTKVTLIVQYSYYTLKESDVDFTGSVATNESRNLPEFHCNQTDVQIFSRKVDRQCGAGKKNK